MTISRRDFLNRLSVATAAIGLAGMASCSQDEGSGQGESGQQGSTSGQDAGNVEGAPAAGSGRVVIVGAGLAGLTAAYELQLAGKEVTILEARHQVGGRVHTQREGLLEGQHAEACGEFIDGRDVHQQMHHYIETFDLNLESVGNGSLPGAYYLDQQRFSFRQLSEVLGDEVADDINRFWDALETLAAEVADPNDPAGSTNATELDAQTAAAWLDELQLDPAARVIVDHYLRGEYDDPEDISLLYLAQSSAVYSGVSDGDIEVYRIAGGNDQLPLAMAETLLQQPLLNSAVTGVSNTEEGLEVQYLGGEIEAEAVVLTAPLPALRDVEFEPGLAAPLPAAIEELGYATHVKTLLQYDERFWLDLELSGDTITDLPLGWIWDATDSQSGDAGILITYTSGSFGEQFAQMDPETRVQTAVAQVEEIYPGSQAHLIAAESVVWVNGPHLFSGFSNYQPGQMTEFWDALRQPHDGIYFAGEHTDIFVGYMEGAVRSGQRVAAQILAD